MNHLWRSDGEGNFHDPFRREGLPVSGWPVDPMKGNENVFQESLSRSQLPCTLFIGDLPLLCNEEQFFTLFSPFGKIESVQVKRNGVPLYDRTDPGHNQMHQPQQLLYGFIKFVAHEDALRAMQGLNGVLISGRRIRVGWARDNAVSNEPVQPMFQHEFRGPAAVVTPTNSNHNNNRKTAQIHVLYVTPVMHLILSEADLFEVFRPFGKIVDVTIKKSVLNQERQLQSGYGFIHFEMTEEGIQSALRAVEEVNQRTIRNVTYEVTVTHGLKTHLLYLSSRPSKASSSAPSFPRQQPDFFPPPTPPSGPLSTTTAATAAPGFSENWNTGSLSDPSWQFNGPPFGMNERRPFSLSSLNLQTTTTRHHPGAITAVSSILSGSSPSSSGAASEGMRRSNSLSSGTSSSLSVTPTNGTSGGGNGGSGYFSNSTSASFQTYLPTRDDYY